MNPYYDPQKRPVNVIWNAAGDYHIKPVFISDTGVTAIDFYLNNIIGLIHKWYDIPPLESLFSEFEKSGLFVQCDILAFITLEAAVYEREKSYRPALLPLRRDFVKAALRLDGWSKIGQIRHIPESYLKRLDNASDYPANSTQVHLSKKDEALLNSLLMDPDLSSSEIKTNLELTLSDYFHIALTTSEHSASRRILRPHLMSEVSRAHILIRNPEYEDCKRETMQEGGRQSVYARKKKRKNREAPEEEIRRELTETFGNSLFDREKNAAIDRLLCRGHHAGCHLLFTDGSSNADRPIPKSVSRFEDEPKLRIRAQEGKNLAWFDKRRPEFTNVIHRLSEKISNVILTSQGDEEYATYSGLLDMPKVWRAAALHEEKVFVKKNVCPADTLCITLLLDASASQINRQEIIASEAYIIAEATRLSGLPTDIYSYLSSGGYTVINRLKGEGIFRYATAGWNRDGLALRGTGYLLDRKKYRQHLLLMLTDCSPNDARDLSVHSANLHSRTYTTKEGIGDTAEEVRALRRSGVHVGGLFYGSDLDWPSAKAIFGEDTVRLSDLSDLAGCAGEFIRTMIAGTQR